ncbi:hypothetical protein ACFORL_11525 [Legionella dresdenensis]|uniref:F-box/LRR-repeat protein 15/At3g58940/PEG3-like LRR domain-containing protein n=1 Tax=Legionella dresdenensis TaxID=450200 RepID=A0ABV8CI79_9GAMM
MPNLNDLYLREKTSEQKYSATPQGSIDINRLLRGLPYWRNNTLEVNLKPKTLVLADWRAANWAEEKREKIKSLIRALLEKQFPIYIWQDSRLLQLSTDNIELLDDPQIRKNITPVKNEDILKKTAADYKLGHDQVHIVNDYWLDSLLDEQADPNEHYLDQWDVEYFISSGYPFFDVHLDEKLAAFLPQCSPLVTTIVHSSFSDNANALLKQLNTLMPQAKCLTKIKRLTLNKYNLNVLIETGSIECNGFIFNIEQLADLEELRLGDLDDRAIARLPEILAKTPKLKKLLFASYISDFTVTHPCCLPALENITMRYSGFDIDDGFIKNLLAPNASTLKIFQTSYCSFNLTQIEKMSLPRLEELSLCDAEVTDNQIEAFLAGCPNLKKLNLLTKACRNNKESLSIPNQKFKLVSLSIPEANTKTFLLDKETSKHLKELTLSGAFNGEVWGASALPALHTYKLEKVTKKGAFNTDTPLPEWPTLKQFSLDECVIYPEQLQNFLQALPNIKRLSILNCDGLRKDATIKLFLNALEHLEISCTHIKEGVFQSIFSQIPNLTALSLDKTGIVPLYMGILSLSKLEYLNLRDVTLTAENPQQSVKGSSRLKKIALKHVRGSISELVSAFDFDNLEELTIDTCGIDDKTLLTLIAKAPRLYLIRITNCPSLSAELRQKFERQKLDWESINHIRKEFSQSSNNYAPPDTQEFAPGTQELSLTATPPIYENHQHKLDADTKPDPDKEFNVERVFYALDGGNPPDVSKERHAVFNAYSVNPDPCNVNDAFTIYNKGELDLVERPAIACQGDILALEKTLAKVKNGRRFYGKQVLHLTHKWQAVRSLSANENVTHYHVEPGPVEMAYSQRDNLYYIRTTGKPVETVLDFLVEVPNSNFSVPNEVKELAQTVRQYKVAELKLPSGPLTGQEYLTAIEQQQAGACRHRALAFCDLLKQQCPDIQARIVENGCHAYVETLHNGCWVAHDLGGYPAKVNIHDNLNRKPTASQPSQSEIPAPLAAKIHEQQPDNPPLRANKALENYFTTWKETTLPLTEPVSFCQTLLSKEHKKLLVRCDSEEQVNALGLTLQTQCVARSRPVFYINSAEDLVCSAPFVKSLNGKGVITKGPGGPLFDFLQAHNDPANPPVLVVNYDKFSDDDLICFNGLLDDKRHADGTALPKGALVIGIQNKNKPTCYQGSDFYSRFEQCIACSVPLENLKASYPALSVSSAIPNDSIPIQLFNGADWKERLLGGWIIKGQDLIFQPGSLAEAIESGKPVVIENGPWDDPEFVYFWEQAKTLGEIRHGNERIKLPENFSLITKKGYDWASLINQVQWQEGLSSEALPLNPGKLYNFLQQYHCDNKRETLDTVQGLIADSANKTLAVNLTRKLTEDQWALLLAECQKHQVRLQVHCTTSLDLPPELKAPALKSPPYALNADQVKIIESSDLDASVATLTAADPEAVVIDISECAPHELIEHIHCHLDEKSLAFKFWKEGRTLPKMLAANKQIILKGRFSREMADALSPWLLKSGSGQLTLVTDKAEYFHYLPITRQSVTASDKLTILQTEYTESEITCLDQHYYDNEGLAQLKARLQYLRANPEANSDKAWQGITALPAYTQLPDFDLTNSAAIASAFNASRLKIINQVLSYAPYALLTGLTAVGKTTFIKEVLEPSGVKVHYGENNLRAWAEDTSDTLKVLFIDEANIGSNNWSMFEGLFNKPPTILIDGILHPLTDNHKVIFAANPLNYGGERILPALFKQHGNAIVFEPLPAEAIYEDSLKPIFANTACAGKAEAIAHKILAVYRFLVECSTTEVLISPRELQMMALLTASYHAKHPESDPLILAEHYAWQLGLACVPSHRKNAFNTEFKPKTQFVHAPAHLNSEVKTKFIITPSRQPLCQQLDDLLNLHDFRQQATNSVKKFGGLGGMIIEGDPGVGKSELVMDRLLAHGFKEAYMGDAVVPAKAFYRMPVSMSPAEKEALLKKAFKQGAFVIADEINSSPMMERLNNDLLSGNLPNGEKHGQPGGALIGTQNPITLAGRRPTGTALARRLINTGLQPLAGDEMLAIVKEKGIEEEMAQEIIRVFEQQAEYARRHNKQPAPTFRHLMRLTKHIIKGKIKAEELLERAAPINKTVSPCDFPAPSAVAAPDPVATSGTAPVPDPVPASDAVPESVLSEEEAKPSNHNALPHSTATQAAATQQDKLLELLIGICSNDSYWEKFTRVGKKPRGVIELQGYLNLENPACIDSISKLCAFKYSRYLQFFHYHARGRNTTTNELYRILSQLKNKDDATLTKVIQELEAFQQQQANMTHRL